MQDEIHQASQQNDNSKQMIKWDYKPHGRTMTPDLALPLPNILRRLFSWYGRRMVFGFKSILQVCIHTAETISSANMHLPYTHTGI